MTSEIVELNEGYKVSKDFYDYICYQVEVRLSELEIGAPHTIKKICGKEFWELLDGGEKKMAGRCLAHMVIQKLLPLDFSGKNKANAVLYELK